MGFSLDLPNEEATKQELVQETAVKPEVMEQIDANVKNNADAIFAVNLDNFKDKKEITNVIENFGTDLIQKSTKSSALMQTRAKDLSRVGGESGQVADTLEKLSIEVRGLDPAQVDFNNDGLLAKIANPVKRYFAKYKTADAQIADIIDELKKGEKILKNDNVTLEMEQQNAKELVAQLTEKAKLGEQLDQYLTGQLETYKAGSDYNEDKARFVEEEILFPALLAAGLPKQGGPVQVMLNEHELGRKMVSIMDVALTNFRRDKQQALPELKEAAESYIQLLTDHIAKEDNVLYPFADANLSDAIQADMVAAFEDIETERIGQGRHEQFHEMLHEFHKKYLK